MNLHRCHPPEGVVEPAPRTSAGAGSRDDQGRWEGFWSTADERYYARCTRDDGTEHWYRFADETAAGGRRREARVLPLRRRGQMAYSARRTMLVGSHGGRTILVGTSRRGTADRSADATGGRR